MGRCVSRPRAPRDAPLIPSETTKATQPWHGAADPAPGGCSRRTPPGPLTPAKPPAAGNRGSGLGRHALPRVRLRGTPCRAAGGETPAPFAGGKYPSCTSLGRLFVLVQTAMLRGSIPTWLSPAGQESAAGANPDPGAEARTPAAAGSACRGNSAQGPARQGLAAGRGRRRQRGAGGARLLPNHSQQERPERDPGSR